jgi:hypothetical protein
LIFNVKEDNLGLTSMYYVKPTSLLVRVGRFNGEYHVKEDLEYVLLINNTLDNNIVEMYFYSL